MIMTAFDLAVFLWLKCVRLLVELLGALALAVIDAGIDICPRNLHTSRRIVDSLFKLHDISMAHTGTGRQRGRKGEKGNSGNFCSKRLRAILPKIISNFALSHPR